MSAFQRHPLRSVYEKKAQAMAYYGPAGRLVTFNPQSRLVRFEADRELALKRPFPNRATRQQRRFARRKGLSAPQ